MSFGKFIYIITVCHICKIILSIKLHDVPSVPSTIHFSVHTDNIHIILELTEITQILECLGIAFTYNVSTAVTVKHIDKLPRIASHSRHAATGSSIVIFDHTAYLLFKCKQLIIISQIGILGGDCLCIFHGCFGRSGLIYVSRFFVFTCIRL